MGSEIERTEQRLKSFTCQLETECCILDRLVYKHKNQHRGCSYFQYILKVRRDLKLLKITNLEEILDASFLVINGNGPNQNLHLVQSLKRRRSESDMNNILERLLGVNRLLSQMMVEPMLKAAMEISTMLARSFFMKFSLAMLAVLARIRVLVQQTQNEKYKEQTVDAVHVYNIGSSLSYKEQTVKSNQEIYKFSYKEDLLSALNFQVLKKEEATVVLECIWQTDKYVLVEQRRCDRKQDLAII